MSIEGVTSAQIIRRLKGVQQSSESDGAGRTQAAGGDQLDISGDARFARTLARVQDRINETPEVRQDRVAEVQERLESGYYDSDEVIEDVADNIAAVFLGEQ